MGGNEADRQTDKTGREGETEMQTDRQTERQRIQAGTARRKDMQPD